MTLYAKRRTGFEIISGILDFCNEPRLATTIMHKNNLSYSALKAYLAKLCALGLLSQISGKYIRTQKGYKVLLSIMNLELMLENKSSPLLLYPRFSPTQRR